jgi:hypothetical protein
MMGCDNSGYCQCHDYCHANKRQRQALLCAGRRCRFFLTLNLIKMNYLIVIRIKNTYAFKAVPCSGISSLQGVLVALQHMLELPIYSMLEIDKVISLEGEFSTPFLAKSPEEWASIKAEMHTYDEVYNINKIRPKDYLEMLNIINEMVGIKVDQ